MCICLSECQLSLFQHLTAMLRIQNGMVPQPFMQSYDYGGGNVQQVQRDGSVELLEDQMLNLSLNGNGTNGIYAFNKLPPSPFACQLCCQKGHTVNECPHVSSKHSNYMNRHMYRVTMFIGTHLGFRSHINDIVCRAKQWAALIHRCLFPKILVTLSFGWTLPKHGSLLIKALVTRQELSPVWNSLLNISLC